MSVKIFTAQMLSELTSEAQQSPRRRQHLNIHQSYEDTCQRLFNAIGIDSYIRPHRHALDPKTETLFAVKGKFALVVFDEAGSPAKISVFGTERFGRDVPPGAELSPRVWHTVVALTEPAILLEMKAGPFDPRAAKEFAPWSPEEGTEHARTYLDSLRRQIVEHELDFASP